MKGFSLIEVTIAIAILAILGVAGMLSFFSFTREDAILVSAEKVVSTLREAQARSISGEQTSTWGVHFSTTTISANFFSLFHGSSFPAATASSTTYLSSDLRFSNISITGGGSEIRFDRLTGKTTQYGSGASNQAICVTNEQDPSVCKKSIRVSEVGKIDWQ